MRLKILRFLTILVIMLYEGKNAMLLYDLTKGYEPPNHIKSYQYSLLRHANKL